MGVLWLKMAELGYIEQETLKADPEINSGLDSRPTLLLDDIFSELDHDHREIVMSVIAGQQTIITTADEHFLEGVNVNNLVKL
jgi:recombinational DNA repair ATPase RecF